MADKIVYFSKPQRITPLIGANTTIIVAGRRTGKTASIAVIISQARPGSSNSLTLSWLLVDEAKFINYDKLKDGTLPANGGIKSHFGRQRAGLPLCRSARI